MRGFLLADKPPGLTSFSFAERARKELGARKAGHAGTLDLFASGLMIILLGGYTKLAFLFDGLDKEYVADIAFGEETDTLDPGGEIVATAPLPEPGAVLRALPSFIGDIAQRPPAYSAVHLSGERAYKKALRGEAVEMPERAVRIDSIEALSVGESNARLRVRCSKGTYIRSLARDLGIAAGTRARLSALRRVAAGPFRVEGAWTLGSGVSGAARELDPSVCGSLGLGVLHAGGKLAADLKSGRAVSLHDFGAGPRGDGSRHCAFGEDGLPIAVVEERGTSLGYVRVLGAEP